MLGQRCIFASRIVQDAERKRRTYMALSKELFDILVCPKCKGELTLTQNQDGLICHTCKLCYPIKDDIPVMLIEEAINLE
jgi:uncharacterized protein YbaR (Trm112 family)